MQFVEDLNTKSGLSRALAEAILTNLRSLNEISEDKVVMMTHISERVIVTEFKFCFRPNFKSCQTTLRSSHDRNVVMKPRTRMWIRKQK